MGLSNVIDLRHDQLLRATKTVNQLARRFGVPYGYWPMVWNTMTVAQIDIVDIAEYLEHGIVTNIHPQRVPHFDVEPGEPDSRIASLTIALQLGTGTVEVVAICLVGEVS